MSYEYHSDHEFYLSHIDSHPVSQPTPLQYTAWHLVVESPLPLLHYLMQPPVLDALFLQFIISSL